MKLGNYEEFLKKDIINSSICIQLIFKLDPATLK